MAEDNLICFVEEDDMALNLKVGKQATLMVDVVVVMEKILPIVVRGGMHFVLVPVLVNHSVVQLIQVQGSVLLASVVVEES